MTKVQKRLLSYTILFLGLFLVRVIGPIGIIPSFVIIAIIYFVADKVDPTVDDVIDKKRESTSELVGEATGKTIAKSIKTTKKGIEKVKKISLPSKHDKPDTLESEKISNEVDEAFTILDGVMRPNKPYKIYLTNTSNEKMVVFTLSTGDLSVLKSKLAFGQYSQIIKKDRVYIFS